MEEPIYPTTLSHTHAQSDIDGLATALASFGSSTPTEYNVHNVVTADAHFGTSGGGSMYIGNNVTTGGTVNDTTKAQWRIAQSQGGDSIRFDRSPAGATWTPTTLFTLDNAGKLTIPGLMVTGGTPGTGKVLTSDASGNATWQTPASSGSGITRTVATVTATVTLGATALTDYVTFIGASGVVTLPTAVGNTNRYTLKNIDSSNKTVSTTSAQTIDGSTTITLTPNTSVDVVSDNANWRVI